MANIFGVSRRRLGIACGFVALIAVTLSTAVFTGAGLAAATPMAACSAGEHEDPYTSFCVPDLLPAMGFADPGISDEDLGQDVFDTPGILVPHVGGTTVP